MPTIYLNHAVSGGLDAPAPWNNVDFPGGTFTGLLASGLTDENGDPTAVDYYVDQVIGSRADRSHNPGTNHGLPQNVWDSLWTTGKTRFTGLPAGASFTLKTAGWDNRDSRHTDFTVAEADAPTTIQYVQASGTPPAPVEFTGTVPANGEITVLAEVTAVSAYWNGIELSWTESGGSVELLVDSVSHGHTAESLALTQAHQLNVDVAQHGHTAGTPTLTEAAQLAVNGVLHTHTADSPVLAQAHVLTVAAPQHGHTAESMALTQAHSLAVADALHGHTAGVVELGTGDTLDITRALHGHRAASLTLAQANILVVQETAHGHTAGSPALVQSYVLTPIGARHGHTAASVTLSQAGLLTIQRALHGHTADDLTLLPATTLVVSDALHGHLADRVVFPGTIFLAGRFMVVRGHDRLLVVAKHDRLLLVE